jgi:hypothetical protein
LFFIIASSMSGVVKPFALEIPLVPRKHFEKLYRLSSSIAVTPMIASVISFNSPPITNALSPFLTKLFA